MKPVSLAHVSDLPLPFEPALKFSQRLSKRQLTVDELFAPEALESFKI